MNDVSFPPETCAALADIEDGATVWVRVEPWWTDPAPGDGASTRVDWRPPPDLVALLDARCDHHNHAITGPNKGECLDCVDGSALFTIQSGSHERPPTLALERSGEASCDDCIVSVPGWWKLNALVPYDEMLTADGVEQCGFDEGVPHVCGSHDRIGGEPQFHVYFIDAENVADDISITGLVPVPGDWVAQITKEKA